MSSTEIKIAGRKVTIYMNRNNGSNNEPESVEIIAGLIKFRTADEVQQLINHLHLAKSFLEQKPITNG